MTVDEIDRVGRRAADRLTSDVNSRVDVETALRRLHDGEPTGVLDSRVDRLTRPRVSVRLVGAAAALAVVIAGSFALIVHQGQPRIVSSDTVLTAPAPTVAPTSPTAAPSASTSTAPSAETPSTPPAGTTPTVSSTPSDSAAASMWTLLPESLLAARSGHTVVWTGKDLIVWGGTSVDGEWTAYGDGAAYEPATGRWRPIAPAPIAGRGEHSTVWTGSEMIVWGGLIDPGCGTAAADGAAYNPETDSWRVIATPSIPARWGHGALWSGTEMIIIGGSPSGGTPIDGSSLCDPPQPFDTPLASAYDPTNDSWRVIAQPPWGPDVLVAGAVWDSHEILVWGGQNVGADQTNGPWVGAGFKYDPVADQWSQLPTAPLTARARFVSAWTGTELIVVGGQDDTGNRSDAAAYDPKSQRWRSLADSPEPWALATAVWTGNELVMVGGCCARSMNATSYDPAADKWTPLPDLPFTGCEPTNCGRYGPAPVWTGMTAIIWGGTEEIAAGDELDSSVRANGAELHLER